MPITIERVEPQIYLSHWIGNITVDDVQNAQVDGLQLADAHGEQRFILIIDMSNLVRFPVDVRAFRLMLNEAQGRMFAMLIVNAPLPAKMFGEAVGKLQQMMWTEFFDTLESATDRARLLAAQANGDN